MVQGELFREEQADFERQSESKPFLARTCFTVTLDQALIGLIGVVVVFVLTYSFGVERGKRLIQSRSVSFLSVQTERPGPPNPLPGSQEPEKAPIVEESGGEERPSALSGLPAGNTAPQLEAHLTPSGTSFPLVNSLRKGAYTVQLVTYTDGAQAAREVERLASDGRDAFVIPSGRYLQVCADYFGDRAEARLAMRRLGFGKRYPDAFVRPVIR